MSVTEIFAQASSAVYVTVDLVGKPLAAALGLSLVVERAVELLKNVLDLLPAPAGVRRAEPLKKVDEGLKEVKDFHEQAAAQRKDEEEEARVAQQTADTFAKIADVREQLATATGPELPRLREELARLKELAPPSLSVSEVQERYPRDTILVQDATDPDDGSTLRGFVLQAAALAVGIVAARVAQLHLFTPLFQALGGVPAGRLMWGGYATDYVLTGLLIGGGSAPVHMLIRFIGARTIAAPAPAAATSESAAPRAAAVAAATPIAPLTPAETGATAAAGGGGTTVSAAPAVVVGTGGGWVDLPYDGGVDAEKLEAVHHRTGKPNLIVFHHTAMPLSSTFSDVVRVIHSRTDGKGRPWITGYHCVVTADGVSHPFCRWDRYGNHAQGFNLRSLGIALNGNFETDPSVPDSNAGGDYGSARPTVPQLETAARVVALWCHVYGIMPRFGDTIIPHSRVSPKTCPGNSFPYTDFERLVLGFYEAWRAPAVQERIRVFAQKPYLTVA